MFRVILICAALFTVGAWAVELTPNSSTLTLLSTVPLVFSWDGRLTATALAMDDAVVYTPDDHTIHVSGEAAHLKYITWRIDSPAASSSSGSTITIYKITSGKTPCRSGTPMMAAGKSLDATQAAGTIGTLPLAADTSVPFGTALCIAADGDFSTSAGTITIGIGP